MGDSPREPDPFAGQPFVHGAMVQTMRRDFDRLRQAIRGHDSFAAEAAWEKCERWLTQLGPVSGNEKARR